MNTAMRFMNIKIFGCRKSILVGSFIYAFLVAVVWYDWYSEEFPETLESSETFSYRLPTSKYPGYEEIGLENFILAIHSYRTNGAYDPYHDEERTAVLNAVSEIHGDTIQLLRFFFWIMEPESKFRKQILRQWLEQMKYDHRLPSLDALNHSIKPLLSYWNQDAAQRRCDELAEVYASLGTVKTYSFEDKKLFATSSIGDFCENLDFFMDKKQTFGSIIFCGDISKIKASYDQYYSKFGRPFDGNNGDVINHSFNRILHDPKYLRPGYDFKETAWSD